MLCMGFLEGGKKKQHSIIPQNHITKQTTKHKHIFAIRKFMRLGEEKGKVCMRLWTSRCDTEIELRGRRKREETKILRLHWVFSA